LITDAFVVVDKETYVTFLDGRIPMWVSPYIPNYQLTEADQKFITKLTTIIEAIYQQYGKEEYKTKLISMFRKMINSWKLTSSQKAVYNQVLIYLFTIDRL
jgi:Lhr-like helicase